MAGWVPRKEVAEYLQEVKRIVSEGRFTVVRTRKFTDTVARLSLDAGSDPREVILGLEVSDYFNGPADDRDRPGEQLWEFGPHLGQGAVAVRLYVKLKLDRVSDYVVCFGFHEAEKPITYPFR